jgi:hypothetical protein
MKKKRELAASREDDSGTVVFRAGNWLDDDSEMLKIAKDGFWVRGVKVPQDEREAQHVYSAFKEWLAWSALSRKNQ